jgi:predicted SprT family Zn-dependent metalloprotease
MPAEPTPATALPAASGGDSRTFWLAAGAITIALVAFVGWATLTPAQPQAAAGPAASAGDARQRELLEANLGQAGDPQLGQLYSRINSQYFQGGLPTIPVRWESRLAEVGELSGRAFTLEGMFGYVGSKSVILLNPALQTDAAAMRRALCHEMVHAHLHAAGQSAEGHGAAFQTILRRLSAAGAFEGIVATDEDRANLKSWLDAESSRLDSEQESLRQETADIDRERLELETVLSNLTARANTASAPDPRELSAYNARRDRYNWRVDQAQTRVERDRTDRAHFNREVERYNLMLAYPDGMDAGSITIRK